MYVIGAIGSKQEVVNTCETMIKIRSALDLFTMTIIIMKKYLLGIRNL